MSDRSTPIVAAFFDVDNTLVRGSTLYFFGRGAVRAGFITVRDLWRFFWQQLRFKRFGENTDKLRAIQDEALAMVANHTVENLESLARPLYESEMRARLRPEAVALIKRHLDIGHEVWIVTATPLEIANEFVHDLGLTGALATKVESVDGVYTGRIVGPILHGTAKADAIHALAAERDIELTASFAYSDSHNDLPMLQSVGHPVATNPDRTLRATALARGWDIIRYQR